jgi:hypothetical protein
VKDTLVRARVKLCPCVWRLNAETSEEFGIYLNYVRKLGFEETPDYDFLRELFGQVLKNNGDVEDGVYDWNLLNGGKGWEVSMVNMIRPYFKYTSHALTLVA